MKDYLKEDLYAKEILKNTQIDNLDLSILISKLQKSKREKYFKEIDEKIAANQDLVGRCFKTKRSPRDGMFPECWRYYKVVSAHSENPYRIECLVFDEYPTYWFEGNYIDDNKCGIYDFTSFYNESLMVNQIKTCEEITADEYWYAANIYLNRLSMLEWPNNHYRNGGVWPHERKWKKQNED